jgi:hypothetical protein
MHVAHPSTAASHAKWVWPTRHRSGARAARRRRSGTDPTALARPGKYKYRFSGSSSCGRTGVQGVGQSGACGQETSRGLFL